MMARLRPFLQFCLFLIISLLSFNVYAVDYTLPADIGSGPFSNCSGAGPYTCAGNVQIQFPDTVTLTAPVTLNVTAEFKVDDFAGPVNAAGIYTMDVFANKAHIDGDEIVNINLTTSGDITVHKSATVVGDLESTGGDIKVDPDSTVDGVCDPDHPQCNGGGGPGPGLTCDAFPIPGAGELRAISGGSDTNVVAVGKNGKIYRFDGTTWNDNEVDSNGDPFQAGSDLRDIVAVPNTGRYWAVGKNGTVIKYNGTNWFTLAAPTNQELKGVWSDKNGEAWVVGKNGTIYRRQGQNWSANLGPVAGAPNNKEMRSAWGDAQFVYVVQKEGQIFRHLRSSNPNIAAGWNADLTGSDDFNACSDNYDMEVERIWGDPSGNLYLAGKEKTGGDQATVLVYDGVNSCSIEYETPDPPRIADKFNGIAGNGNVIYAVGKNGIIAETTSGSWEETQEGGDEFKDVWVSNTDTAYYAGKNGSVTRCVDNSDDAIVDHFLITPNYSPAASTCLANAITIQAINSSGDPVVDYDNLVNITVQTRNHGNWSKDPTAMGALVPDPHTLDDGAVTYTFSLLDLLSSVVLNLTNTHAESVFIRVNDPTDSVTTDSGVITFSENLLVVSEDDALQIAGKPKPMKITMVTDDTANSGSCGRDPNYNSANQILQADIIRSVDDPGGSAPLIGLVGLPTTPATPVTLDFSGTQPGELAGEASFTLNTTDVGKYRLDFIDESSNHSDLDIVTSSSPELTMRPFGIAVTGITGLIMNTNNDLPTGDVFALAGTDFSATVEAVLWDTNDDPDGDGVINAGRVFFDNVPALKANSYAWDTTLRVPLVAAGFTPSGAQNGVQGNLYNGALMLTDFTTGTASPSNLQYDEVGSFTLQSTATGYLNTVGADFDGDNIIVGRFKPAAFRLTRIQDGMFGGSCPLFGYIGESFSYDVLYPAFLVEALDGQATPNVTSNYNGNWAKLDVNSPTFTTPTELTQNGTLALTKMALTYTQDTDLFTVTDNTNGSFTYIFEDDQYVYGKDANSEVGDFNSDLVLDITDVTDTEMVTNATNLVLRPTPLNMRFGRVRMGNVHGSELSTLDMPMIVEYRLASGIYTVNSLDNCTTIANGHLLISDNMTPLGSSTATVTNTMAIAGDLGVAFTAPGTTGFTGYMDITPNLAASVDSWLQYDWTLGAGAFNENPTGRATFGIYTGSEFNIYRSQTYQ
jgi:hypothetical protein